MTLRPRASTSPGSCVSTLARRTVWQGQLRGRGLSEEYSHPFKGALEENFRALKVGVEAARRHDGSRRGPDAHGCVEGRRRDVDRAAKRIPQ